MRIGERFFGCFVNGEIRYGGVIQFYYRFWICQVFFNLYFSESFREILGYFVTVDMEELFAILGMIILWKGNGKSMNKRLIF